MSDKFKRVIVRRGFTEIKSLYNLTHKHGAMILGGYVRYMVSTHATPHIAGDVDVYCRDDKTFKAMHKALLERHLVIGHENEISLSFKKSKAGNFSSCPAIQLIKPLDIGMIVAAGDMERVLENFDFTIVRAGLITRNKALVDIDFIEDELHQRLVLKNIHCPVSSLLRCCKYTRKGYYLRPAEAMKLFVDWDARDDDYRMRIVNLFKKSNLGDITEQEVNELEVLLRID